MSCLFSGDIIFKFPGIGKHTEGSSDYFVSPRIIECDGIYYISVSLESQQLLSSLGAPNLTSSIVAPRDEFISLLVESAIGQWKYMSTQNLE